MYAQQCTTMWPYLYSDFAEGKVFYKSGNTESRYLNIHVLENRLHLVDGENISELKSTNNIAKVEIGWDTYLPIEGRFYQLISEGSTGSSLVLIISGDFRSLLEGSGAYGASSNSLSTTNLSSLEIGGNAGSMNHMNLKNNKDAGRDVPLVKKYFFVFGGNLVPTKSKDVEKSLLDSGKRKELKAFVKANKIKWNRPEDLAKLLAIL